MLQSSASHTRWTPPFCVSGRVFYRFPLPLPPPSQQVPPPPYGRLPFACLNASSTGPPSHLWTRLVQAPGPLPGPSPGLPPPGPLVRRGGTGTKLLGGAETKLWIRRGEDQAWAGTKGSGVGRRKLWIRCGEQGAVTKLWRGGQAGGPGAKLWILRHNRWAEGPIRDAMKRMAKQGARPGQPLDVDHQVGASEAAKWLKRQVAQHSGS